MLKVPLPLFLLSPQSELFLFMEYCPEGNVWSLAQQGLPEALVRKYTCQILHGVNAIHEHGIVHRDIKGKQLCVCMCVCVYV